MVSFDTAIYWAIKLENTLPLVYQHNLICINWFLFFGLGCNVFIMQNLNSRQARAGRKLINY